MPSPVVIELRRRLPVEVPRAFAWLTDIQDDDAQRTGAVIKSRRVLERSDKRIVYEGETGVMGNRIFGRTEVVLSPPDAWEARVVSGPRTSSRTDYRLVPLAGGCELTVRYQFVIAPPARHLLMRLAKPILRRDLERMWDGFVADLRRELTA